MSCRCSSADCHVRKGHSRGAWARAHGLSHDRRGRQRARREAQRVLARHGRSARSSAARKARAAPLATCDDPARSTEASRRPAVTKTMRAALDKAATGRTPACRLLHAACDSPQRPGATGAAAVAAAAEAIAGFAAAATTRRSTTAHPCMMRTCRTAAKRSPRAGRSKEGSLMGAGSNTARPRASEAVHRGLDVDADGSTARPVDEPAPARRRA